MLFFEPMFYYAIWFGSGTKNIQLTFKVKSNLLFPVTKDIT